MASIIRQVASLPPESFASAMNLSREISLLALWDNFIDYYKAAYKTAIAKAEDRAELFVYIGPTPQVVKRPAISEPKWTTLTIQGNIPKSLLHLMNWPITCGGAGIIRHRIFFNVLTPNCGRHQNNNPILLLDGTDFKRFRELEKDQDFLNHLDYVYREFKNYMAVYPTPGFAKIAYFSMEFGLHASLKLYSGGLGLLAGDYLKEASDSNIDMVGVGLLYRYGYFDQVLSVNGEQQATYKRQAFGQMPLQKITNETETGSLLSLALPGRTVTIRLWKLQIGRIPLILLDTDFDLNDPRDQSITHQLYGGDLENRLKQEWCLVLPE
jgi:phosphorylase/glycogen(starch) synthase